MTPNRLTGNSGSDEHFEQQSSSESFDQDEVDSTDYLLSLRDRQLRAFFEGAIDAMVITDDEGRYLDVNPAACELFGLSKQALLGRRITEFCEPGFDFTPLWQNFQQEARVTGELRLVQANGSVREVEYAATAHFLPHRHLSVMRDITDRKQMERELYRLNRDLQQLNQELEQRVAARTADLQQSNQQLEIEIRERQHSEALLRETQQISKVGGWAIDLITGGEYWSEEVYNIHELPLDFGCPSVIGQTEFYINFYVPEARQIVRDAFQRAISHGESYDLELPFITAKQRSRWVRTKATAIREQGKTVRLVGYLMDITDRKRAEIERDRLFNVAVDLFGVVEFDGYFKQVNPAFERLLGYSAEELCNQPFLEFVHPDDVSVTLAEFNRLREGLTTHAFENRYRCRDGSYCWLSWTAVPFVEEGLMYCTARDISHHKQAEAALRESEERFRSAFDYAAIGKALVGLDGHFLKVNRSLCEITGYTEAELLATNFQAITHPDDLETDLGYAQQLFQGEIRSYQMEKRYLHKQGHLVWILLSGSIVRDVNQQPLYFIAQVQDITVHKQIQAALQESEERYRSVVTAMAEGVVLHQADGQITAFNHSAEQILGLTADQILGQTPVDLDRQTIHEDGSPFPGETHPAMVTLRTGQPQFNVVMGIRQLDRPTTWLSINSQPLFHPHQTQPYAVVASFANITPQKQIEATLRQSEANLAAAQRVTHVGNWEFDIPSQKIVWSEEMFRIFGLDPHQPEPPLSEHIQQIHPDDRVAWQQTVQQSLQTGEPYIHEFRLVRPDGSVRVVEGRGEVVRDASGRVIRLFGTTQDITERKQLEDSLRWQIQKQNTLSHLIQTVRQSLNLTEIFSTTAESIGQFSNADRVEIMQYHPEQKLWRNVADYRRTPDALSALGVEIPDEGNAITARLKRLEIVRIGTASQNQDPIDPSFTQAFAGGWLLVPLHIGSTVWGALSLVKQQPQSTWQDAEVELLLTVANQLAIAIQQSELYQQVQSMNLSLEQQVTARTAELRRAFYFETILQRIVDNVRDSLDEAQILQTAMQELALALKLDCCTIALYALDQETVTIQYVYTDSGISDRKIVIKMSEFPELYDQLLQRQSVEFCYLPGPFNRVYPGLAYPDRNQRICLAQPIVSDQEVLGDLWLYKPPQEVFNQLERRLVQQVAIHCAIALRQSYLYQEIQSHAAKLESLDKLKDEFLSTVTHELRSPMANIKMAVQMLEVSLTEQSFCNARTQRYLQILKEECNRETNLINDLLDLSRLESGQLELDLTSLELKDWLPQVIQPFEERVQHQQQQLSYHFAPDLPPLVTDASHLQRILRELLHNACKYTPAHEQIIVNAEMITTPPIGLKISVINTGIEIPEAERDRVFEKFYRIQKHDPWKYGGTGLGLALIKKLSECLGGSIQLEMEIGQTNFTLQLPLHP